MPGSSASSGGGSIGGMTLKGWVLFNGTTGAIQRQSGVASVVRSGAGAYGVTLSNANSDAFMFGDVRIFATGYVANQSTGFQQQGSTTYVTVQTYSASAPTDFTLVYVGIYGA